MYTPKSKFLRGGSGSQRIRIQGEAYNRNVARLFTSAIGAETIAISQALVAGCGKCQTMPSRTLHKLWLVQADGTPATLAQPAITCAPAGVDSR